MGQYAGIVILILLFVLMYFLMIRPQKKQQKKKQEMLSNLTKGEHVITIGGLHGIVDEVNKENKTVTLDCDGLYLVFDLRAIGTVEPVTAKQSASGKPASKRNSKTTGNKKPVEKAKSAENKEKKDDK